MLDKKMIAFEQNIWLSLFILLLRLTYLSTYPSDTKRISNTAQSTETEFILLHNNDMHGRFHETNGDSTDCSAEEKDKNRCYGGFARIATVVRKYRDEEKKGSAPVLYLNAGDTYQGSPWFTLFKNNITAAFLNKLEPNATCLGNHEFDLGIKDLASLLDKVKFPVLAANLDVSKEVPEMAAIKRSTILNINGISIGVIGYLTPETKDTIVPNHVEFHNEIEAINEESSHLKSKGINIIIALGHSGYDRDLEIAAACPDLDVIVGGHTHTFLYNGTQPDREKIEGPYPTIVTQATGRRVLVVQAYAYTKYLGMLHLKFNDVGELMEFHGSPILLDSSIEPAVDVLELLDVYRHNITAMKDNIIGHTTVYLEGNRTLCRSAACIMGNLITDSWVYASILSQNNAYIAFTPAGGIRNSIPVGDISEYDVVKMQPFENELIITQITGKTICNALEHAASLYKSEYDGGFLQMSGVRVTYDYNKEIGQRVRNVEVRCVKDYVLAYEPLDHARTYSVITTKFLIDGGDNHVFVEAGVNAALLPQLEINSRQAIIQYIKKHEYVYPEVEKRIRTNIN